MAERLEFRINTDTGVNMVDNIVPGFSGMILLLGILQYMSVGAVYPEVMPPAYNPQYDLDGSGWIDINDLLLCLALF